MRTYLNSLAQEVSRILVLVILSVTIGTLGFNHYFPRVSSIQRIKTLPLLGDVTRKTPELYKGVVILTTEAGVGFCSGSVIDNNYIVTAAHCLVDGDGRLNTAALKVRTDSGQLIDVRAKVAAANTRVDVGLVVGDFTAFQFIPINYKQMVDFSAPNQMEAMLKALQGQPASPDTSELTACGYPEAQATLTCIPIHEVRYDTFQLIGRGQLFPGMSGGPVFANTLAGPQLVAVNTAITFEGGSNIVILSPVLGLQGEFDIY